MGGSGLSMALPLPLSILGVDVGVGDFSPSDMTSKTVSSGFGGSPVPESALADLRWMSLRRSVMRSETVADRTGGVRASCGCNSGDVVYLSPYALFGANLALVTKSGWGTLQYWTNLLVLCLICATCLGQIYLLQAGHLWFKLSYI